MISQNDYYINMTTDCCSYTSRFGSVREKLLDPTFSGWFVKFNSSYEKDANGSLPSANVPRCDTNFDPRKCSDFYHGKHPCPSIRPAARPPHPLLCGFRYVI